MNSGHKQSHISIEKVKICNVDVTADLWHNLSPMTSNYQLTFIPSVGFTQQKFADLAKVDEVNLVHLFFFIGDLFLGPRW